MRASQRSQQIRERWNLLRSILQYGGVGRFLGVVARAILMPLVRWRTFCFFERDMTAPVALVEASIPLEIRIATDADFERFRDVLLRENIDEREIAHRRASGDLCFIGVAGGRLIHFTWLMRRPVWLPALGATLELEPDDVYAHFSYTDPEMRGRGAHPAVVNFELRWEHSVGIRRHVSFVMGHNVSALRIMTGLRSGTVSRHTRTIRTVRFLAARGFLARGLGGEARPHLKPGAHVDLGRLGLWIKPLS